MKTSSSIHEKHAAARKIVRKEKLTPLIVSQPWTTAILSPIFPNPSQTQGARKAILERLAAMNLKLAEVFEIPTSGAETGYDAIQGHDNHIQILTGRAIPKGDASFFGDAGNVDLEAWMKTHLAPHSTTAAVLLKNPLWPFPSAIATHPVLVDAMGDYVIELFAHLYARLQALGLR